ncbi:protein farnesyltransferase/geranylgeranyltransferase type-1 subunit alpha-like [Amphibalanus amphitrite]|uniref:protein farnesyltransferase/geranylgeranyltransferase type-1 subunit alpha-like n=1 Tax=Amphibalanus amphitrite TaxID=1232801 RepID=UPI001C8FF569|nr:protein farnesyltransferase/geranylgeranyltransferase type-1 subunit alpha-like [Amphibalanus amphitrite]XP_043199750.1 protein farnesyltransferase/geranylgeranyltransferase type-1 subunit alpha-like [Amphibalanus amphitrite]XP_043199751.1 protein farnesyltransferase/geranylgeranyltransferase type-1 subunit alpha-like [Amphibalanus amphitrite]XP_043199753.1 protein farnesyltransferase/geranylgeranyltransferase type-1 subunit alpha-like [Amphibalanus amphitrite]XP_043199754.1 protein farnesyl
MPAAAETEPAPPSMFEEGSVDDPDWVPYGERPDWQDVQPVPQDDGPEPVVRILYSERFTDVYDRFRALLASGEVSERALRLTSAALELNPANYSVWHHRRHLLQALDCPLERELDFTRQMIEDHPKNYQVWHHRRVLVERRGQPGDERRLTEIVLSQDPKNFHAWQYRQWAVRRFDLFDGELEFAERLLEEDVRNNSAWNQRYFVCNNTTGFTAEVVAREVSFCLQALRKVKQNESAWNYLRGVLFQSSAGLSGHAELTEFCDGLLEAGCRAPQLLAFVVDASAERAAAGDKEALQRALRLCDELAAEHDTIRAQYWLYRRRALAKKHNIK